MARIAIGGFQHETNTFAPSKADYAAFEAGGGWPGVQYGERIFGAVEGANIPAAGAIRALRTGGHSLVGTAWAAANPSAHVTAEAFERIAGRLVGNLKAAGPLDGSGDTIVLSTADRDGNMVAWVNSLFSAFGSGLVVPGYGITLHNRGALFTLDPAVL